MSNAHLLTDVAELVGAITTAVIGEQSADGDAVGGEKVQASFRKAMVVRVF